MRRRAGEDQLSTRPCCSPTAGCRARRSCRSAPTGARARRSRWTWRRAWTCCARLKAAQGRRTASRRCTPRWATSLPRRLAEAIAAHEGVDGQAGRGRRQGAARRWTQAVNAWRVKPVGVGGLSHRRGHPGRGDTDGLDSADDGRRRRCRACISSARWWTSPAGWAATISSGPGRRAGRRTGRLNPQCASGGRAAGSRYSLSE